MFVFLYVYVFKYIYKIFILHFDAKNITGATNNIYLCFNSRTSVMCWCSNCNRHTTNVFITMMMRKQIEVCET
jgi:hypothetical protein